MSYIIHYFDKYYNENKEKLEASLTNKFYVSDNISLLSAMNESCHKDSILAKQCSLNNVFLHIPQCIYNITKEEWKNPFKIKGVVSELDNITTPYALILDGKDTCVLKNIDETFLEIFEDMKTDIVFNYQRAIYPPDRFVNLDFKHLNAGVCFGKLNALKEFYSNCLELTKDHEWISTYNSQPSEQYIVRLAATQSDLKIEVDSGFKLFQIPALKK